VQVSKIWMIFLLSSRSRVDQEVRVMCEGLAYKTPLVLRRVTGGLRNCDELVQHLNPACRAARLLPALPVSRLLMSLNDRDVPLPKRGELNRSVLLLFLFTLLACLPNAVQDTTIDVGLGMVTAFAVMGLGLLEQLSMAAFAAVIVVGGLVVLFLCLGGYSLVRLCWAKKREEDVTHERLSVVGSFEAALAHRHESFSKGGQTETHAGGSFSLQVGDGQGEQVKTNKGMDKQFPVDSVDSVDPVDMQDSFYAAPFQAEEGGDSGDVEEQMDQNPGHMENPDLDPVMEHPVMDYPVMQAPVRPVMTALSRPSSHQAMPSFARGAQIVKEREAISLAEAAAKASQGTSPKGWER
ncbi:hypothetical protein B484DRAFT_427633, partial [Ochromonadaceae sp. CCMP2298]